jgi:hypothetical protein
MNWHRAPSRLFFAVAVWSCIAANPFFSLPDWYAISALRASESMLASSAGGTSNVATATDTVDFQLEFYQGLVNQRVPPSIAALMTADTVVISEDDERIHFVQTMIGGGKRDVEVTLTQTEAGENQQVPFALDDGSFALAESINISATADGYRTGAKFYIPAASIPPDDLLKSKALGRNESWWFGLLGIHNAWAQGGGSGLTVGYSDSFSGPGPAVSSSSSPSMQSLVQDAGKAISDQGNNLAKAARDVSDALRPVQETAKTVWQNRADMVKNAAQVMEQGAKVLKALKEDDAMRKRLRALRDCAENPTAPTAKDAQKNDPNYRKATTDTIKDAERNLRVNTTIRVIASTGNAIASTLLKATGSKGLSKGTSILQKVEDSLLKHVAEEYIMKDAGKGVVPCEPDCGDDGYNPPVTSAPDASQGSLNCEQPAPKEMVCRAGPAHTSGSEPRQPAPGPVCGVLKHAEFTYKVSSATSGCSAVGCFADTNAAYYSGTADLVPDGGYGYDGKGRGSYHETDAGQNTSIVCSLGTHSSSNFGSGTVYLHTWGYDDGPMPTDDSMVEVLLGYQMNHEEQSSGCGDAQSASSQAQTGDDEAQVGCEFHGVDLTRPGFYRTFRNGDPQNGICTMQLTR